MKIPYFVIAAAIFAPASANAETVWRGAAILTAVTGCGTSYKVGDSIPVRYYPADFPGNDQHSKFAFHATFYAQSFAYKGKFPSVMTDMLAGKTASGTGPFSVTARMKMKSILPTGYTATTPSLAFVGEIENFKDTTGCNVSFRASAALSIE